MSISVTLKDPHSPATLTIEVTVKPSKHRMDFKSPVLDKISNWSLSLDPKLPYLTPMAIDAACCSATAYSRHVVGKEGVAVKLLSFDWQGKTVSTDVFARAIVVAVCKAFPPCAIPETEECDWIEVKPEPA